MKTFKEERKELRKLKTLLDEMGVEYHGDYGNHLSIYACSVGDNFYDYGEEETPLEIDEEFSFLKDNDKVEFIRCRDCCGCAGW